MTACDPPSPTPPDPRALATALNDWFADHGRSLAWRHPDTTAWGILVSEVMAQQTPVRRVEPLWHEWMLRWPTPSALAAASTADVIRQWANLGYPRRALRLQECAQACVDKHEGQVPSTVGELEALPGIGTYTARAVAAFAFGQAVPVVDTNVRRVYRRLMDGEFLQGPARARDLCDVATLLPHVSPDPALKRCQEQLAYSPEWADAANLMCASLMELGALVCTATSPSCQDCPVKRQCRWVALGSPEPSEQARAAAKARVQKFAGTDRQVRGIIMAAVRSQSDVTREDLTSLWPDRVQLERCVNSLVEDRLIEQVETEPWPTRPAGSAIAPATRFRLPGNVK